MKLKYNTMIRRCKHQFFLFILVLIVISSVSCNNEKELQKDEEAQIQSFLSNNSSLNFVKKLSGLYYLEVVEGTGIQPVTTDTVYVFYTGKFLNGTVFGTNITSARKDTLIFPINESWVILGFDEGINYMKVGGKSTLLIPSYLAYGTIGRYPYITGYTPLLYDIELVRVKKGSAK